MLRSSLSVRVTYYSSGPAYYSEDEGTTYRTTLEGQEEEVRTSVVNSVLCSLGLNN